MTAISARQLLASGTAKRTDGLNFNLNDIHVEPGFNYRLEGEDLEASIEALVVHIAAGGTIPPLEVRGRAEGGVWIVDGHRRHAALRRCIARGVPLANQKTGEVRVSAVLFDGNDADRVVRVMTSAEGRGLSPIELAEGCKRLAAFNWSAEQIAAKVHKSADYIRNLLTLSNANSDVQALVKNKRVSASEAVKVVKKHGERAGVLLAAQLQKAEGQGKTRITAKTMRPIRTVRPTDADLALGVAKHFGCTCETASAWLKTFGATP